MIAMNKDGVRLVSYVATAKQSDGLLPYSCRLRPDQITRLKNEHNGNETLRFALDAYPSK